MKTKDGYSITENMWISDDTGIYEISDIRTNIVTLKEIVFNEDNPDEWEYGDLRYLTPQEIKHMTYL